MRVGVIHNHRDYRAGGKDYVATMWQGAHGLSQEFDTPQEAYDWLLEFNPDYVDWSVAKWS